MTWANLTKQLIFHFSTHTNAVSDYALQGLGPWFLDLSACYLVPALVRNVHFDA